MKKVALRAGVDHSQGRRQQLAANMYNIRPERGLPSSRLSLTESLPGMRRGAMAVSGAVSSVSQPNMMLPLIVLANIRAFWAKSARPDITLPVRRVAHGRSMLK